MTDLTGVDAIDDMVLGPPVKPTSSAAEVMKGLPRGGVKRPRASADEDPAVPDRAVRASDTVTAIPGVTAAAGHSAATANRTR
ncbi:MAG: hypothetical protein ACR2KK_00815 [Acidimicrobiales bacterium]